MKKILLIIFSFMPFVQALSEEDINKIDSKMILNNSIYEQKNYENNKVKKDEHNAKNHQAESDLFIYHGEIIEIEHEY